ncbi:thiamine-triphosphatase isoform X2 [Electrophorus electricus]|uniref:thiamine-triphosphatase isoform X2 n=1 Tax=Electrophorus electricus TaxID=8005 RepID=UPI000F0A2C0F|nr:thiamine-triphosphatase isoform X2 [Electrophorus electricus]
MPIVIGLRRVNHISTAYHLSFEAVCIGQCQFKDQYFDLEDFTLTLRDFWLRKREGHWELKCPASSLTEPEQRAEAMCTNYREVMDLAHIKAEIMGIIENCPGAVEDILDSSQMNQLNSDSKEEMWLKELKLQCFAEYTTTRCSYVLDDGEEGRVRVDLDQADFGYCVGEIEVLVSEGGNMQSAMQRIEMTAEKLGLAGEKIQGKMHVFLQRYRPDHYAQLVCAHVL